MNYIEAYSAVAVWSRKCRRIIWTLKKHTQKWKTLFRFISYLDRTVAMIFELFKTCAIFYGPCIILITIFFHLTGNYFNRGLHRYPGPFLCAITNWLRFFKAWQRTPEQWHIDLHQKHGNIVRLGPNCLSFGNPKAIKTIYALGKGFTKVHFQSSISVPNWAKIVRLLSGPDGNIEGRKKASNSLQYSIRRVSLSTEAEREQRI